MSRGALQHAPILTAFGVRATVVVEAVVALAVVIGAIVVSALRQGPAPAPVPDGGADRVAGWRSDITRLVEEARRVHASPSKPAHAAAFGSAAARLAERIPDLPDRLVVVEFQRLMAMLGDGHSLVYPAPGPRVTFAMLPIDLGSALRAPAPGATVSDVTGPGVTEPGVTALIVDVRHNNGGNNMLLAPLVKTIADFAAGDSSRRVFVLTSRSTFSAAQNFINRLERSVRGVVFAGEPSMSSPNFTGEDNPVPLPFSGLTVSISNRYWQDSDPGDKRPWITPHLSVSLSSRDWLENRDPVLDAVLGDIMMRRR